MLGITRLLNPIQPYPWGSRTAIAVLLGRPSPAPGPEAELWLGAHPKAPSEARVDGRWVRLDDLIRQHPAEILGSGLPGSDLPGSGLPGSGLPGSGLPGREGGELPFLLKVLAAAEPLSIQAHPDRDQARQGFRREEELGIPRDAAHRNYRDPHPKPEILYALTPFSALRGFRPPAEIHRLLLELGVADLLPECRRLAGGDAGALEGFFRAYMALDPERVEGVLETALRRAADLAGHSAPCRWIVELGERYPGDLGALSPALLNLQELEPGEVIYTGAGVLHAYLGGVGVELMTSSDNVLRGGLTGKHVDVPELLSTLRFEPLEPRLLEPADGRYATPEGLVLEVIEVRHGLEWSGRARIGSGRPAILLASRGEGTIRGARTPAGGIPFARGDSFLLPAAVGNLRITGSATLFRAEMAER